MTAIDEAKNVWAQIRKSGNVIDRISEVDLKSILLDFFHVGSYYIYLFEVKKASFSYISPEIMIVLGYDSKTVDFPFFMSKIHPDDQATLLNNEKAIVEFFEKIPQGKMSNYKVSYDYRVMNNAGVYVRLLQQWIIVQYDVKNGNVTTLGIHTDISHLKKGNASILSFLGLDGEPSFIDVHVKNIYRKDLEVFTKREREVLALILQGESTAKIAKQLFLSVHTVNTHRKNIMAKTDTKNIIELAVKVINDGLL